MSPLPSSTPLVTLSPASAADFEDLLALRIAAMRESLSRLGRFDPIRARERLRASFAPELTRHILVQGERVGFVLLRPLPGALSLEHLYVHPRAQRRGIGARVLLVVFEEARQQGLPVRVTALRGSDSNAFYQRHGFVLAGESEWDIHYVRPSEG